LQLLSDLLLARSPAARLPFRSVFNKRALFLQRARVLPRRNNRLVSPLDISSTSGVRAYALGRNIKTPACRNKRLNRCLTITSDKQLRSMQIAETETEEARFCCRGCYAPYSTVSSMLKRFFSSISFKSCVALLPDVAFFARMHFESARKMLVRQMF